MSPTQWYIAFWLALAIGFGWWAWRVLYWLDTIALWLKAIGEDIARLRAIRVREASAIPKDWLSALKPPNPQNRQS